MGERCEARTMEHGSNYKGEIRPDQQYCSLQMSIRRRISVAVILSRGDGGGEWEREMSVRHMEGCGRLWYEIGSSGGFTHSRKCVNIQWYWRHWGVSLLVVVGQSVWWGVFMCPCLTVGTGRSQSGWFDCSSPGSCTLYTTLTGTPPQSEKEIHGTTW